jgi:hypothetical protein
MEPTQEFIDAMYREKVTRARAQKPEDKVFTGAELFEEVCNRIRIGIRNDRPNADADEVERIMKARFERLRRVREFAGRAVVDG